MSTSYVEALSKVYGSRGAHSSRKVLSLFSGPYEREDGRAAYLNAVGITTVQVDNDRRWGDTKHDILKDDFFQSLIRRVAMGEFLCIMAAPPFVPPSALAVSFTVTTLRMGDRLRCGPELRSWASTTSQRHTSVNWRMPTRSFDACASCCMSHAERAQSL